ncbi:MAG: hypothetical protein O2820_02910 [Planctomycetota bacterium]|nr:hypothetical protein [Planctomycetota bacterium]MDA1248153.1 hypothetical protein [Planctomycetota bacterium]
MAKKPIHKVRVDRVVASIWQSDTEKGPRYFVTFEHFFRAKDGWQYSNCFSMDDLLPLAKAADQAHTRVSRLLGEKIPEVQ